MMMSFNRKSVVVEYIAYNHYVVNLKINLQASITTLTRRPQRLNSPFNEMCSAC